MVLNHKIKTFIVLYLLCLLFLFGCRKNDDKQSSEQKFLTFEEYLEVTDQKWFLTGKKEYRIQAMMVSKETKFHNDYEEVDYTVKDDGETVILKGTRDEMWTTKLAKVINTYTKIDKSTISENDFKQKDVYIDLLSKAALNSNYAMFVPLEFSVTVETAWGNILHTNLSNLSHNKGDYLVCSINENGDPDLSDVWVLNGDIFKDTYDTSNVKSD